MKKFLLFLVAVFVSAKILTVSANSCFTVSGMTIIDYSESCGSVVEIPTSINGKDIILISPKAFANKNISSVSIPSSIGYIGEFAFYGNNLTNVNIPNGVLYIGPQAFAFNNINSVILPDTVDSIGDGAFEGNCISNQPRLDILDEGWKREQYGCDNILNVHSENNRPKFSQNIQHISGNILFPNFKPKENPILTDLKDSRLDIIKNQFGQNNSQLTRQEFIKILIDSAWVDLSNVDVNEVKKYKDLDVRDSYAKYFAFVSANNIMSGYDDNTFRRDKYITRDEATKILVKSLGVELAKSQTTFSDIDVNNTLGIFIQTAYNNKIINGTSSTTFEPKKNISKWELYKIIYNILN